MRQMASNYDSLKRENLALTSNLDIFRRSEEQLRIENSNLKELINNIEGERIHYRAISEQLQRELEFSRKESSTNYSPMDRGILMYDRSQQRDSAYQLPMRDDIPRISPTKNDWQSYQNQYMPPNERDDYPRPDLESNPEQKFQNFHDLYNVPSQQRLEGGYQTPIGLSRVVSEETKKGSTPTVAKKEPQKLPMHLASSVTFEYPDQFDQYYRKNMDANTPGGHNVPGDLSLSSSVNPHIREDAQKAYFKSHLENVFDWENERKGPRAPFQFPEGGFPSGFSSAESGQMPQGSQGPAKAKMNNLQKHEQVKKLENSLLTFQMEKDRLTAELEKIPESHRLSHNHTKRKQELNGEIELLDKNINTVKLKLRDIKS